MKRNYTLDVIRLLLAYEIALYHLGIELPPSPGVAVDVFFILSGYFLARRFYSAQRPGAWEYTVAHTRGIYPHYLLSLGVFFGYQLLRNVVVLVGAPSLQGLKELGGYFYDQIADLFFLQSSHYFEKGLLYPTWQISATLIAGYFVYALLEQNEGLTRKIILPASVLMVLSLMYSGADYFDNVGIIYLPLLRGFSGLGIGVLVYHFHVPESWTRHPRLLDAATVLALLGVILYQDRGRIHLILVPFLLAAIMQEGNVLNRLLNHRCFRFSGKLSLAVYLNHTLLIRICETQIQPRLGIGLNALAGIYVVILTVYSVGTMLLVEWMVKRIVQKRAMCQNKSV